jgi:threonine/homoserine/homoserine lactone efflux protein
VIAFETLAAFVPAALAVVLAPGPDTLYTLTASVRRGRAAGVAAGVGTGTGVLVHTAGAVLGLSLLLRTSDLAYTLVSTVGAAYLGYLGAQTFRRPEQFQPATVDTGGEVSGDSDASSDPDTSDQVDTSSRPDRTDSNDQRAGTPPGKQSLLDSRPIAGSYGEAVVVNVSNPKVAVFVLAFLPQFVPATADATLQLSLLGVVYAGLSVAYLGTVAAFAGHARRFLVDAPRVRRLLRYVSGTVFLLFAVELLLASRSTLPLA